MIRLLVVDDQALIRDGLTTILDAEPDLEVVGTAEDGLAALAACREHRPDVVLMDVRMPRMDGATATREITAAGERPRVLVLTTFDEDDLVLDAMEAGAAGFLLKDVGRRRLVEAVRAVHEGELVLSSVVARRLVDRRLAGRATSSAGTPDLSRLTGREHDVLVEVAAGLTNGEIAARLHLGESTVKTHVGQLLAKLHARDRVQLVITAYAAGLGRPSG